MPVVDILEGLRIVGGEDEYSHLGESTVLLSDRLIPFLTSSVPHSYSHGRVVHVDDHPIYSNRGRSDCGVYALDSVEDRGFTNARIPK